jgi:K+-transporting ATPase ATPase C chain
MVTSSGSGLDPHISPQGAYFQIERISVIRHLRREYLKKLVLANIEKPYLGLLGPERVNVLKLNLALDNNAVIRN